MIGKIPKPDAGRAAAGKAAGKLFRAMQQNPMGAAPKRIAPKTGMPKMPGGPKRLPVGPAKPGKTLSESIRAAAVPMRSKK